MPVEVRLEVSAQIQPVGPHFVGIPIDIDTVFVQYVNVSPFASYQGHRMSFAVARLFLYRSLRSGRIRELTRVVPFAQGHLTSAGLDRSIGIGVFALAMETIDHFNAM